MDIRYLPKFIGFTETLLILMAQWWHDPFGGVGWKWQGKLPVKVNFELKVTVGFGLRFRSTGKNRFKASTSLKKFFMKKYQSQKIFIPFESIAFFSHMIFFLLGFFRVENLSIRKISRRKIIWLKKFNTVFHLFDFFRI